MNKNGIPYISIATCGGLYFCTLFNQENALALYNVICTLTRLVKRNRIVQSSAQGMSEAMLFKQGYRMDHIQTWLFPLCI